MIRVIASLLILATTLALATPVLAADVIGLSLPLSGRYARVGQDIEQGVLRALADHSAKGGVRPEIALIDDGCNAAGARSGIKRLARRSADVIIGVPCFEPALVYAEETDLPVLAAGLRHPQVEAKVTAGRIHVLGPAPDAEALTVADRVLTRWRNTPFALVDDGSVRGRALTDRLRALAEERGLRPQQVATFRPLQSNQSALLRRLKQAGVEAVFVAGEAEDVATFARDAARLDRMEVAAGETGALLPHLRETTVPSGLIVVARPPRRAARPAALLIERLEGRSTYPADGLLEGYALTQVALALLDGGNLNDTAFDTVLGRLRFRDGRVEPQPFEPLRWNGQALVPLETQ